MGLSIHRVVVFVGVVLYRTWMLLWKRVVIFVGLLYSMGSYVPEFMVCQLRYLNESTHDIKTLKHLYFDVITDVFIFVHRLSTSCNLVSYMLLTTIASFTAVTLNGGERHMMVSSFSSLCKYRGCSKVLMTMHLDWIW